MRARGGGGRGGGRGGGGGGGGRRRRGGRRGEEGSAALLGGGEVCVDAREEGEAVNCACEDRGAGRVLERRAVIRVVLEQPRRLLHTRQVGDNRGWRLETLTWWGYIPL